MNNVTKLAQLVNPEVMAQMVSAALPNALRFSMIAAINTTLVGQPGNTITLPKWEYVGDAKDVAEGQAIDITQLKTSHAEVSIKKAGQAIALTDEAILSGYGDPIGQATHQLALAIANKVDDDIIDAMSKCKLHYDGNQEKFISYEGIVDAVDALVEEEDTQKVLFIHPKQVTTLRKDPNFLDKTKYGGDVMVTGSIGTIAGCQVIVSRKVKEDSNKFTNYIVCLSAEGHDGTPVLPAVSVIMKRSANVEADRDILTKETVIVIDQHYGVAVTNDTKVLRVQFKSK